MLKSPLIMNDPASAIEFVNPTDSTPGTCRNRSVSASTKTCRRTAVP